MHLEEGEEHEEKGGKVHSEEGKDQFWEGGKEK